MSVSKFWVEIARRGWGIRVDTAFMFGDPAQPTIGLQVILDPKDGVLRSEIVHHEALQDESRDAILEAAERLLQMVEVATGE